jgi:hypothetical protein
MQIRKAERKKARIKMALQGGAGSGKTYSSLLIAFGLCQDWSKVVIIDTENSSADLYSDLGSYNVLSIQAPYEPEKYIKAIGVCEQAGMEVIIIDSTSHCWDYLIDVHANMQGNSFTNWSKITPRQNAFINAILQGTTHVIATMRVKQDYVLNFKDGKHVPEKVGLKAVQRDGVDYEFTVVFDIDIKHHAVASKDRTKLFVDKPEFTLSKETGELVNQWCNSGIDASEILIQQIESCESMAQLRALFNSNPEVSEDITALFNTKKSNLTKVSQVQNNLNFKFNNNGSFTVKR